MKKRIVTFFVLLCIGGDTSYGQTISTRNAVRSTYDVDKATREISAYTIKAALNKQEAFIEAEKRNVPTSGVNARGNYFELSGIDANGILLYKSTLNYGSRLTARVNAIQKEVGVNQYLEGEGMTVGIIDGLPLLDTHQEFYTTTSNTTSRVTLGESLPSLTEYNAKEYQKSRFHATHVGATMVGLGYNNKAQGIAPKAKLVSYSWNNDYRKMGQMASGGTLVSNHSYGYNYFDDYGYLNEPSLVKNFGTYSEHSREFDRVAYLFAYYQPVIAAGNDGEFHYNVYGGGQKEDCNCDLLNDSSVSKNAVVVAAVEEVAQYTGPSDVILASFSSQGPTNDFRIKPDISAKGVDVLSAAYRNPSPLYGAAETSLYTLSDGTSMAAPAVSGVFTLWQEWAIHASSTNMPFKSATLRALMAHTADEAGRAKGPDHLFGWGVINAKAGVDVMLAAKDKRSTSILENELREQQKYTHEIQVSEKMSKMVVTLAWTDAPGVVSYQNSDENYKRNNSDLVNDLDVVVRKGKNTYYPWKLNKDFNDLRAIQGVNDVDNIEKIELYDVEPGTYVIEVTHKGRLQSGKQQYSLISTVGEFDDLQESKVETKQEVRLWPNPVVDHLYVSLDKTYNGKVIDMKVYDMNGRLVLSSSDTVQQERVSINMASLNSNIYVVEVKAENLSKTVRIAKR
ncbi:S8 family serine peptidase [Myroides odoratimimus]|uniref:S8 family serine peptidase n=1 Tax=Myroides odoratimimus TaxID=76832 RepID=UPI002578D018|nr:S8 family serine peptidase [Myroides odoratimimus]MDM1328355.1 S8 family serine peptidase [Myroides odoratimimus]